MIDYSETVEDGEDWDYYLAEALECLPAKRMQMDKEEAYYEGRHPRHWLTKKMRKMFRRMSDQMIDNLCRPAIDTYRDHLRVESFSGGEEGELDPEGEAVTKRWITTGMRYEQRDWLLDLLMFDEAFLFSAKAGTGERDETGEEIEEDEVSVVDPRFVHWQLGCNPRKPAPVVLLLPDLKDKIWRASVYFDKKVYRLEGPALKSYADLPANTSGFTVVEVGNHGFDRVPVDRASSRPRSYPLSMLRNLMPPQDRINKVTANKMVSAEYGAFAFRAAITGQPIPEEALQIRPDTVLQLPSGMQGEGNPHPTSLVQFPATPLANFDDSIMHEKLAFYTLAGIPKHMMTGVSGSTSGDAIEADSGPFLMACASLQETAGATLENWAELWGHKDVTAVWRDVRPDSDSKLINNVKIAVEAGVPIDMAVEKYGNWDPDDVETLSERKEEERAKMEQANLARTAMLSQNLTGDNGSDE